MSEAPVEDPAVKAMRLRAGPPKPLRLSRKVALAGAAGLAVAIAGAAVVGLGSHQDAVEAPELTRASAPPPDAVRGLPSDYVVPQLGPPLPGDLARPILKARNEAGSEDDPPMDPVASTTRPQEADARQAERQRRRAEAEAARVSALTVAHAGVRAAQTNLASVAPSTPLHAPAAAPGGSTAAREGTERLLAGSVIEASLVTGIRSDLPGIVLAQITSDVHDSRSGRHLLIPKGSRLIGTYSAQIAQGQSRLQIVWTRLVLPDGDGIPLPDQTASDPQGYAGLEDRTDQRWGERLRFAALTTLLAISGAAVDVDQDDRLARALRDGATDGMDALGRGLIARGMAIPSRLTLRPGLTFRIILNEDLDLPAYGDKP